MNLNGLRVPEAMILDLFKGKEMSITINDDIDSDVGSRFVIYAEDSNMQCEVEIVRVVRGPAVQVFEAVSDEPAQSGASVLDAITGFAMIGRPPTTPITFLCVKAVLHEA